ncbi:MAG TPA: hypothetical protein VLA93_04715 [Pyrinomonadaceae bacterium]|nr:hypothetical protein [Pyrinomonadaceae bacterium]
MYCSSCGGAVVKGLSYCNHCGAKLNTNESIDKASGVKPDLLVTSMVATFIFGIAVITMLMGVMKVILGLNVQTILVFIALPFLLMLCLEGVFIRLLLRRNRGTSETTDKLRAKQHETNELDAAHARALPEPIPSVTEHTTRAFEPIYRDQNAK